MLGFWMVLHLTLHSFAAADCSGTCVMPVAGISLIGEIIGRRRFSPGGTGASLSTYATPTMQQAVLTRTPLNSPF